MDQPARRGRERDRERQTNKQTRKVNALLLRFTEKWVTLLELGYWQLSVYLSTSNNEVAAVCVESSLRGRGSVPLRVCGVNAVLCIIRPSTLKDHVLWS